MNNWAEQMVELQHTWLDQQQQLMSAWLGSLQHPVGIGRTQNAWHQAIDVNEQQINNVLDIQRQVLTGIAESVENAFNTSLDSNQLEHRLEEGIELWMDTQQRLWKVWFDMLRSALPSRQSSGEVLSKNWQDIVERAMDFQEQCLSTWTNSQSDSGKSMEKRPTKSSASKKTTETAGNS